jgi:hypothetical protein
LPIVAVQRTIVSPAWTTTAPLACLASLPVSKEIWLSPTSAETRLTSNMLIEFSTSGHPDGGQLLSELSFSFAKESTGAGASPSLARD